MRVALVTLLVTTAACGGKHDDPSKTTKDDAGSGAPKVAPLAMPTLGIDSPKRMNFTYDAGAKDYGKAVAAYAAKPRDWAAVRAGCEAAIAKDAMHLDAHRLLGTALAQAGEHAAAVDHLVTAIAGDYYKYAPSIATDEDLKEFNATPHGQSLGALLAKLDENTAKRVATGVWVVARRSTFKWAAGNGAQPNSSRGELYAYDRETKRYIRLSHTNDQVVGYVRAPAGGEVALLGFDKAEHPKDKDAPSLISRGWIAVLDTKTWKPIGTRTTLPAAREISVGYGAGEQLLSTTAAADGHWAVKDLVVSSVDRTTGKLVKVTAPAPEPRVAFTLDEGRIVNAAAGVKATWAGDPETTATIETAQGAKIPGPLNGTIAKATVAASDARIAFATAADPCAKDAPPSLYVADAKTGALKHVYTAKSRFATRWIEPTVLAYEDGEGSIRVWDATTGREAMKIENKTGIALDALSLEPSPLCKQAPPVVEPVGSGSDDSMPPEDGTGSGSGSQGPVTAPSKE